MVSDLAAEGDERRGLRRGPARAPLCASGCERRRTVSKTRLLRHELAAAARRRSPFESRS